MPGKNYYRLLRIVTLYQLSIWQIAWQDLSIWQIAWQDLGIWQQELSIWHIAFFYLQAIILTWYLSKDVTQRRKELELIVKHINWELIV